MAHLDQQAFLIVANQMPVGNLHPENGAFSAVAPHLWNAFPREVRLVPSLYTFRRQAKAFLFNQAFA